MGFFDDLMNNIKKVATYKPDWGNNRSSMRKNHGSVARPSYRKPKKKTNPNKAWGDRYQKQADSLGAKRGPKNWPGTKGKNDQPEDKGPMTGGGDYGGGDSSFEAQDYMGDVMNQIAQMTTPSVTAQQIDIGKTLAGMYNPQFKAIANEVARTKDEGKENSAEIKAAYKALEQSISKDDAKAIDKSYKKATKDNSKEGAAVSDSMAKAMSAQAAERRKDAQNLGIESALGQDSGAQEELAKGIADAAKSTQSQNQRLSELKKADQQLNRDAASTAEFQGNESVSALKSQVAEVLAGLGTRRLDTKAAKANTRLQLETQNQQALQAAQGQQSEDFKEMLAAQTNLVKDAQNMQFDQAEMLNDNELQNQKLANDRYKTDAKYANEAEKGPGKDASVLEKLVAMSPGGLGAKSLQGVMSNMDSFYANGKGTWNDAYKQYAKTYKNSARSKDAAREYLRIIGKR